MSNEAVAVSSPGSGYGFILMSIMKFKHRTWIIELYLESCFQKSRCKQKKAYSGINLIPIYSCNRGC